MAWFLYVARFMAGVFLANAVPHVINGISGRPFPSPFASPPGKGESSPVVNVLWGGLNAAVGYVLLYRVGTFQLARSREVAVVAIGAVLTGAALARAFGEVYKASSSARR